MTTATLEPRAPVSPVELVALLSRRGVRLWVDGDNLRFKAPPGALTPELKGQLVASKAQVIGFLSDVRESGESFAQPAIEPVPRDGELPLSFAQERLWLLDRLDPGSASYNIFDAIRLEGEVSAVRVSAALSAIFARHEVLRTTFDSRQGRPMQRIAEPSRVAVPVVDLERLPASAREPEARRLLDREVHRGFDLARGPLLRTWLLRLRAGSSILLFDMHHIVSDGWSTGVLVRELASLHAALSKGTPPALPPLPIQYADFAAWQRRRLGREALDAQMRYWRRQLADLPDSLELPADRLRPAVKSSRGATHRFALPPTSSAAVRALAREREVTPFVVLLSGFMALLSRYTGQEDVVVGTPTANRNRREIEPLIGFFVNTLVLRGDLSGVPAFGELLGRVREASMAAQERQDLPFERLVEELAPQRDLSKTPLFQAMFVFQNAPAAALEVPGLSLERLALANATTKLDLTLSVTDSEPAMTAEVEYSTDLFDGSTVERMMGHFRRLLASAASHPERTLDRLELMSAAERHAVLAGWNDRPAVTESSDTVVDLIERRGAVSPDAVAVVFEESCLTYGELVRRSRRLAWRLCAAGAGPEAPVGVFLERSVEMIVAVLAVLQSGGPYVPLDPSYPEERLSYMLEEPGSKVMVTSRRWAGTLAATGVPAVLIDGDPSAIAAEADTPLPAVPPEAAAYVIYTSGSTGRPKGVINHHRALSAFVRGYSYTCRPALGDRFFLILSFAFDASVGGVFPALAGGATLVLHPAPAEMSSRELSSFLERQQVTLMDIPVNFWNHWMEDPAAGERLAPALRAAVAGGEPLYRDRLEVWGRRTARPVRFYGAYGPTETTVAATVEPTYGEGAVPAGRTRLPIGRPIRGVRTYLLDRRGEPVPAGVAGEVFLAGTNVTRGYLNEPAATAGRFVPDPWGEPGARMYKTGDYARHLPDGRMEFLTRRDDQVKIRGFRIEPAEVEAALGRHPEVALCAVVPREVGAAGRQLVAYVVAQRKKVDGSELRAFLGGRLPSYMVPSVFVFLESLPRNPASDKVDVRALPDPEPVVAAAGGGEPRNTTEEVLCGIWGQLLGAPRVGIHDDFFELGGHSLLATQLVSRVGDTFGIEVPLRVLFEGPTVADLAQAVERAVDQGEGREVPALVRVPRDGDRPVSFSQERMWLFEQLNPGTPTYNTYRAGHTWGPLSVAALTDTYEALIERHESLRTGFVRGDGRVLQRIHPHRRLRLPLVDLTRLTVPHRQAEAFALAQEDARHPVPLDGERVSRARLLRLDREEHVFLWSIHHIAYDLWSGGVLLGEVEELYLACSGGRSPVLPELPFQYADFAVWQRGWLAGDRLERDLAYWREKLAGIFEQPMELPTDRPRPAEETHRGHSIYPRFDRRLTDELWALAKRHGATQFMVMLAGLKAVLGRYTGHPDAVVGTFISNRNRQELEGTVGYFDNTVVLRTTLGDDPSFEALLMRVRETSLGAYAHQHLPFETLSAALRPRNAPPRPLFSVDFVFELNYPAMERELAGLRVMPYNTHSGTAKFDLNIGFREAPDGLRGEMELNTDLFDVTTIERLAVHLRTLLTGAVRSPERRLSELPLLSPAELQQLRHEWQGEAAPGDRALLHELFERQAERTPEAPALVYRGQVWSYRRIEAASRALAARLQESGVGPERPVGVAMARTPEMVVALLAVLRAGGAYVPLDPAYPAERLRLILEDTGAAVVLSRGEARRRVEPALAGLGVGVWEVDGVDSLDGVDDGERPLGRAVMPGGLAYLIYTSGSTGRPKGVAVEHRSAVAFLRWARGVFDDEEIGGMLASTSINFDLSVFELFLPLSFGGTVVLADNALELPSLPDRERVRTVNTVPSAMAELVKAGAVPPGVRTINLAGEPFTRSMAEAIAGTDTVRRMLNLYGPSEDTTYSTSCRVAADGREPTIGRPVAGTVAYVVDRTLAPRPPGVAGELCLGGRGLARGYLNRPARTAGSFVPDPFSAEPGARLYRTGDLVRHRVDGEIEFLGRIDHQVKVRGFRIELGEIEAALREDPALRHVVVMVCDGKTPSDRRLVACLAAEPGHDVDATSLRRRLAGRLPEYMIPSAFLVVESMPLTPTGKVDRKALARLDLSVSATPQAQYVAPRSGLERTVAGIWQEILGVERVGRDDSFFELGGHSLLLMSMHGRLRQELGDVELDVVELFDQPTVAALAAYLERKRSGGRADEVARPQRREQIDAGKDRRRQVLERRRRVVGGEGT